VLLLARPEHLLVMKCSVFIHASLHPASDCTGPVEARSRNHESQLYVQHVEAKESYSKKAPVDLLSVADQEFVGRPTGVHQPVH
jgi:hypothetical protein